MSPSAVSPFVTTYAAATPYITVEEFLAAPTALEIDDLIPGGTEAQQIQAITDQIARASSWIDVICNQVLAATLNTERDRYLIKRGGYVAVPLRYKPVLEVTGIKFGRSPSLLVTMTDFSDVDVKRNGVHIPVFPASQGNTVTPYNIGSKILVEVSYINGWCNALLAADVAQGAMTVEVNPVIGVYPGSGLRISDGPSSEVVVVDSIAGDVLTLAAPATFTHSAGISISNLPSAVKQAAILLTSVLIQTRGNDAIILDSVENPTRLSNTYGASGASVALAMSQLTTVTRVW
jgi:hypothetical protein